jgi:hypothetical protein
LCIKGLRRFAGASLTNAGLALGFWRQLGQEIGTEIQTRAPTRAWVHPRFARNLHSALIEFSAERALTFANQRDHF